MFAILTAYVQVVSIGGRLANRIRRIPSFHTRCDPLNLSWDRFHRIVR